MRYGTESAPSSIRKPWRIRATSRSVRPARSRGPRRRNASLASAAISRIRATSSALFTIRTGRITGPASTKSLPRAARIRRRSTIGIWTRISGPISAAIRPRGPASSASASITRLIPSSAGRGAGQARRSSIQLVARMPGTLLVGTTATGSPVSGRST